MSENILQNIIKKKEIRIAELKKKRPLESIPQHPPDFMNYVNFKQRIGKLTFCFILLICIKLPKK